jgi:hypothetical protein
MRLQTESKRSINPGQIDPEGKPYLLNPGPVAMQSFAKVVHALLPYFFVNLADSVSHGHFGGSGGPLTNDRARTEPLNS